MGVTVGVHMCIQCLLAQSHLSIIYTLTCICILRITRGGMRGVLQIELTWFQIILPFSYVCCIMQPTCLVVNTFNVCFCAGRCPSEHKKNPPHNAATQSHGARVPASVHACQMCTGTWNEDRHASYTVYTFHYCTFILTHSSTGVKLAALPHKQMMVLWHKSEVCMLCCYISHRKWSQSQRWTGLLTILLLSVTHIYMC